MNTCLSIVTTCHPDSRVMSDFFYQLEKYTGKYQLTVDLVIVDDLDVALSNKYYEIEKSSIRTEYVVSNAESGQTASIIAGFKKAKFELVLSIDPDMGSSLYALKPMLTLVDSGADVVIARRRFHGRLWWRTILGGMFNIVISLILGFRVHDVNSPMFLVQKKAVADLVSIRLPLEAYKLKMLMDYHDQMAVLGVDDYSSKYHVASTYRFFDLINLAVKRIWLALCLRLRLSVVAGK